MSNVYKARMEPCDPVGIEEGISVLEQVRLVPPSPDKGQTGFEKWIGWDCVIYIVQIGRQDWSAATHVLHPARHA